MFAQRLRLLDWRTRVSAVTLWLRSKELRMSLPPARQTQPSGTARADLAGTGEGRELGGH